MIGVGLVMLAMRLLEMGPAAHLDWMWVLSPFALAVVWWQWSDLSGRTRRKAMEQEAAAKAARQKRQMEALSGSNLRSRR